MTYFPPPWGQVRSLLVQHCGPPLSRKLNMEAWLVPVSCAGPCQLTNISLALAHGEVGGGMGGGGGEPVLPLWSAGDAGASMSPLCLGGPAGRGQHDGRERRLHQVLFRVFPALGRAPAQWPRDKVIYWAGDESKHWAGMIIVNGNSLAIRHCQLWCRRHCNKLAI